MLTQVITACGLKMTSPMLCNTDLGIINVLQQVLDKFPWNVWPFLVPLILANGDEDSIHKFFNS